MLPVRRQGYDIDKGIVPVEEVRSTQAKLVFPGSAYTHQYKTFRPAPRPWFGRNHNNMALHGYLRGKIRTRTPIVATFREIGKAAPNGGKKL